MTLYYDIQEHIGIFYSSIGRRAAMMRWRYAGVTPMLRRLLSALMMLSPHLSRLKSKLNIGVYKTSAPTDRRVKNAGMLMFPSKSSINKSDSNLTMRSHE